MKRLGIIGGTGPESTIEYYARLSSGYRARKADGHAPAIIINSVDNKNLVDWFTANQLDKVTDYLEIEISTPGRRGCRFRAHRGQHALFGTRFTMQANLFPDLFAARGMTIVVPNTEEQAFIHEKYMGELFVGTIRDETRTALIKIVEVMREGDRIDGLILGGTELSLILREPTAAGLPVLDTTQIHVDAAIDRMLEG